HTVTPLENAFHFRAGCLGLSPPAMKAGVTARADRTSSTRDVNPAGRRRFSASTPGRLGLRGTTVNPSLMTDDDGYISNHDVWPSQESIWSHSDVDVLSAGI